MVHLRLVKPAAPSALAYENRMGERYYLHEGKTKTGKARCFFAKVIGDGALAKMPAGFEVTESINGVVSVRKKIAGALSVPDEDVKIVEAQIGLLVRLRGYMVRTQGNAIVVFEPDHHLGALGQAERFIEDRRRKARYAPLMQFEREGEGYVVRRMTYRGQGGWSYPLGQGKLAELASSFVSKIGTDAFFDLM